MDDASPSFGAGLRAHPTFQPEIYGLELLSFARRLGAGAEAEDLVQDSFVRVLERPPREHARPYLYRTCLNLWRDRQRRRSAADRAPRIQRTRDAVNPLEAAAARELVRAAYQEIQRLPDQQRLCLVLRLQRHMDYDEVGVVLDCSAATARQHFHLAIKAVRDHLGDLDDA